MTDDGLTPYLNTPVRLTLADGRVLAGVLTREGDHGHGHAHYRITDAPVRHGEKGATEVLHGASVVVQVEDASNDPAATL